MKKILIILLMLIFTLTWCSCGMNEKKIEVYKYSDENVSMELSVFAENDDVYKVKQVSELNIKGYSDREVKEVEYRIKEMEKTYKAIDGMEYSTKKGKNKITESISIPVNEKTMEKIKKEKLIPVETQEDKSISLKKFTKSLENNGWKLKK